MKKQIDQIFSLALAVTFVVVMAVPVYADVSDAAGYMVGEFWDMMTGKEYDMYFNYWKNFTGYLVGEECPSSPDKYHHGNTPVGGIGSFASGGTDDNGRFVLHICDYCQKQFKVYASDLQQSYDAQVAELPAQGITSAGHLIWQVTFDDFVDSVELAHSISGYSYLTAFPYSSNGVSYTIDSSQSVISFSHASQNYISAGIGPNRRFYVPISGSYRLTKCLSFSVSYVSSNGTVSSAEYFYPEVFSYFHLFAGANWNCDGISRFTFDTITFASGKIYFPVYEIIPDSVVDTNAGSQYNINSRPTSITGDYGIIGDNGQIIKVEGNTIVNETNNNFYNPATGETSEITDWSYDYSTRTYTLTLGGGTTTTVTYGDENVTIIEGGTTYNVYYLVDGSGSENPGPDVPATCNHFWTESSTIPATCTVPGSRLLTCSLCGQTKTEVIPAPGHTWTIRQTVTTEYDDEGNKTQDGYTIFECTVCGEQYKSTDGGAPPGSGSGIGSGSSGGVFSGIFGLLVDFLGFFWNTFRDFVGEGVKGFLIALMDGTSSIFGLLNPFNWGG